MPNYKLIFAKRGDTADNRLLVLITQICMKNDIDLDVIDDDSEYAKKLNLSRSPSLTFLKNDRIKFSLFGNIENTLENMLEKELGASKW